MTHDELGRTQARAFACMLILGVVACAGSSIYYAHHVWIDHCELHQVRLRDHGEQP